MVKVLIKIDLLRRERRTQDLTQEELAVKAGITADFLGAIERGQKQPSVVTLAKLAHALGKKVDDFLDVTNNG